MRFFRVFLVSFFACVAIVAGARTARAQSCVPANASVTTVLGAVVESPDDVGVPPHNPGTIPINSINYSDCVYDKTLRFTIGGNGLISTGKIEVWAGSQDCGGLPARTPATQTCWPVISPRTNVQAQNIIDIKVRDVVAFINSGTSGAKPPSYTGEQPASFCDSAQTVDSASQISLYFFITDSQSNVCGSEITYNVTVDLLAGGVAGTPTATAGDGLIFVDIPPTTDPDIKSWNVYTDPPPYGRAPQVGDASTAAYCDAGTSTPTPTPSDASTSEASALEASAMRPLDLSEAGDASGDASGDDGGSTTTEDSGVACVPLPEDAGLNTCPLSPVLVSGGGTVTSTGDEAGTTQVTGGHQALTPAVYLAANVGATSTKAQVPGLANDTTYVVAVAAVDGVGNVGPLAVVPVCGVYTTPDPVGGFWATYTAAGGQAGGGFCALDAVGAPAGSATVGLAVSMFGIAFARRRRRAKKEAS